MEAVGASRGLRFKRLNITSEGAPEAPAPGVKRAHGFNTGR
jgi:hypothetical protein